MKAGPHFRGVSPYLALLASLLLAGCELMFPVEPVLTPRARPAGLAALPPQAPSAESAELRAYYANVLNNALTQGLLRTDGGGPDTPYTAEMLVRNFETIAFFSEFERGAQPLRRWQRPVRFDLRFGPSVTTSNRTRDANAVVAYARRLARVTGHPVSSGGVGAANFHVFFAGEDDRPAAVEEIRELAPTIDASTLDAILNLPRSTYCLVVAFPRPDAPAVYSHAIALIRAEQPDIMRLSCIHEELAQGLGLANDSPFARPSIFNDDDEFALLTSHDEKLLTMLYDNRLTAGMSAAEARPILREIAAEFTTVAP